MIPDPPNWSLLSSGRLWVFPGVRFILASLSNSSRMSLSRDRTLLFSLISDCKASSGGRSDTSSSSMSAQPESRTSPLPSIPADVFSIRWIKERAASEFTSYSNSYFTMTTIYKIYTYPIYTCPSFAFLTGRPSSRELLIFVVRWKDNWQSGLQSTGSVFIFSWLKYYMIHEQFLCGE